MAAPSDRCIAVLVKSVPVAGGHLRPDGDRLTREGAVHGLDPVNEVAVEWSVAVRDSGAVSEIVAVTMGPDGAADALRRSLAMGCDRAVHVEDPSLVGADVRRTAAVLAATVEQVGADIVVLGSESLDGSSGAVPAAVATALGRPLLSRVRTASLVGATVTAERDHGRGSERVSSPVPVVVSFVEGGIDVRYPKLREVLAARSAPLEHRSAADLGVETSRTDGERVVRVEALDVRPRTPLRTTLDDGVAHILDELTAVGALDD